MNTIFDLDGLSCELIVTADGSYSLRYALSDQELTEPMHSSKGAWAETLEIYEPAMRRSLLSIALSSQQTWTVSSVGLGLGYNELLSAGWAFCMKLPPSSFRLDSYESQPQLIKAFVEFCTKEKHPSSNSDALHPVYADILNRISEHLNIEREAFEKYLAELLIFNRLQFHGGLNLIDLLSLTKAFTPSQCILFDAFSPTSSPDLWEPLFLEKMIARLSAPQCIFVSYASRTVLKNALRTARFTLETRNGFAGKRESTCAVRV